MSAGATLLKLQQIDLELARNKSCLLYTSRLAMSAERTDGAILMEPMVEAFLR